MVAAAASRRRTDLGASPFHTASQKLGYPTDMIDREEEKTLSYITLDTSLHEERT